MRLFAGLAASAAAAAVAATALAAPPPPPSPDRVAAAKAASCPGPREAFTPLAVTLERLDVAKLRVRGAADRFRISDAVRLRGDAPIGPVSAMGVLDEGFLFATRDGRWIRFDLDWNGPRVGALRNVASAPIRDRDGRPVSAGPTALWRVGDLQFAAFPGEGLVGAYGLDVCGATARRVGAFRTEPGAAAASAIAVTDYSYGFFAGYDGDRLVTAAMNYADFGVAAPTPLKLSQTEVTGPGGGRLAAIANPLVLVPMGLLSLWDVPEGTALREFDLPQYMHFGSREPTKDRDLFVLEGFRPAAIWGTYDSRAKLSVVFLVVHDETTRDPVLLILEVDAE